MTRWTRINELFHGALSRPVTDREAFLASECGEDAALREEVESLLVAHESNAEPHATSRIGVGTRFGDYEVTGFIGAGAMGEVYRARDTKLGREVALKVMRAVFLDDAARRARFEREARMLASLNHPNIGTIYGLVEAASPALHTPTSALALELVDGVTLGQRIGSGRVAVEDALRIAKQIVDALAAAHQQGIVHRDLKPANVVLTRTGVVKVLDFGLAKLVHPDADAMGLPPSPENRSGTAEGVLVGTPMYMSPEQARGEPVDRQSDIWAFGCVLYEMLTTQRAFPGNTVSDTVAAVLERQPDWCALPEDTPAGVRRLLERCLQKDRRRRLHDMADAGIELDDAIVPSTVEASPAVVGPGARKRRVWTTAAVLALISSAVGGVIAWSYFRPTPSDTFFRSSILLPESAPTLFGSPSGRFAVSPDGSRLVFAALASDGQWRLWVRQLDGLSAEPLAGTEGAVAPFWSPDSRFVGFFDTPRGKLKAIDANGGPPLILADSMGQPGASWGPNGIVFAVTAPDSPLRRVPAKGGTPTRVTTIDPSRGETQHWLPFFLPDGRHFLYLAVGSKAGGVNAPNGIYVGALDSNERKLLVPGGSNPKYAAGHLLFLRQQTLMAQPFDVERLELTGEATPIAEQISVGGLTGAAGAFSVSDTGILAYQSGTIVSRLVWLDRSGKQLAVLGDDADYDDVELSPDETRVGVTMPDETAGTTDIWLLDVARGVRTRFTFDPAVDRWPIWSPDDNHIIFGSNRNSRNGLYQKASSGVGPEHELEAGPGEAIPVDWSRDGRFLVYNAAPRFGSDLSVLALSGDRKSFPFMDARFIETAGRLSPDGRWIAYVTNESGRLEVYVTSFPKAGARWQISTGGGDWPRWRRDGKELFYVAPNNRVMAAVVNAQESTFTVGQVSSLFDIRPRLSQAIRGVTAPPYDVSADGQRFLVNTLIRDAAATPITLVVNWPALLKTRP